MRSQFCGTEHNALFLFVDLQPQKKELLDFMRKYINELDEKQEEQIAKQRSSGRSV